MLHYVGVNDNDEDEEINEKYRQKRIQKQNNTATG